MAGNSIERDAWNNTLARPSEWLGELTRPIPAPVLPPVMATPPRFIVAVGGQVYVSQEEHQQRLRDDIAALDLVPRRAQPPGDYVSREEYACALDHAAALRAECDALRADAERWREEQELRAVESRSVRALAWADPDFRLAQMIEDARVEFHDAAQVLLEHEPDAIPRILAEATAQHRAWMLHRAYVRRTRERAALCAPETDEERAARAQLKEKS